MKKHSGLTLVSLLLMGMLLGCTPQAYDVPEQSPMTNSPIATAIPLATETATATLSSTVVPSATPEPQPTATATPLPPTPTMRPTPTTIPAAQMRGEWRRITIADGLCTDSLRFIGGDFIGAETTTFCYLSGSLEDSTWPTHALPQGTYVYATHRFPTNGDLLAATDEGLCLYDVDEGWGCVDVPEEKYVDARQLENIDVDHVYMLSDSVLYLDVIHGGKLTFNYNLPEISGSPDARPTTILTRDKWSTPDEIWVGTNGYGLVLIHPETQEITRYTIEDGLPSNTIHDISNGIWIATDNGVAYWDGQHWHTYTVKDGLPSNNVLGIAAYYGVWIATDSGAAYFDKHSWQAFTRENGLLPDSELTDVWGGGTQVWFSTRNQGLLIFTYQMDADAEND